MKTNGACPACQGRLSMWTGMKAPTPFHFRCPHCKAGLRIAMRGLRTFLTFLFLAFVALAIAIVMAWQKFGTPGLLAGLACYALAWLVAELVLGVMFYTYGTFTVRTRSGGG